MVRIEWNAITRLGKDFQGHWGQPSIYHQYCLLTMSLSTTSEHFQGRCLHHTMGSLSQCINTLSEIFPNIQPDLPLALLEAITSHPVAVTQEQRLTPYSPPPPVGSCREQWGLSSASSSPVWPTPAPLASPYQTCAPEPSQLRSPLWTKNEYCWTLSYIQVIIAEFDYILHFKIRVLVVIE